MLLFNPNPRTGYIIGEQHVREMQAAADMAALAQVASGGASSSGIHPVTDRLTVLEHALSGQITRAIMRLLLSPFALSDERQPDDLSHNTG